MIFLLPGRQDCVDGLFVNNIAGWCSIHGSVLSHSQEQEEKEYVRAALENSYFPIYFTAPELLLQGLSQITITSGTRRQFNMEALKIKRWISEFRHCRFKAGNGHVHHWFCRVPAERSGN